MVAGEHDLSPTCLSDWKHDDAIQNHVLHYLGCIEISERNTFYKFNNDLCNREVDDEYRRLFIELKGEQAYRHHVQTDGKDNSVLEKARENVRKKLEQWEANSATELRRINYLRALIAKDKEVQHLVWDLEASRTTWKGSNEYKTGLLEVKKWRAQLSPMESTGGNDPTITENRATMAHGSTYPSNTQHRQQIASSMHDSESNPILESSDESPAFGEENTALPSPANRADANLKEYEPEKDFNLHIIEYEDMESPERVEENQPDRVKRLLPEKKMKINEILCNEKTRRNPRDNPLHRTSQQGRLSYIHLPANNMIWVEEAIARYYGEERPQYDGIYRELQGIDKTQTYMVLRPQFWRGQLHGGRSAPSHARHMRPLCNTVSSNPMSVDQSPKNIVLFMPYLHWETDRQRNSFALEIESITEYWKKAKNTRREVAKAERQEQRSSLPRVIFKPWPEKPKDTNILWKAVAQFASYVSTSNSESAEKSSTQNSVCIDQRYSKSSEAALKTSQSAIESVSRKDRKVNFDTTHHAQSGDRQVKWRFFRHKPRRRPNFDGNPLRIRSFPTLIKSLGYGNKKTLPVKNGRVITQSPLGQFMIDAARLYEEMSNYRDKKLFQKYLHSEPPLHPRRTLDQAYYWTLDRTDTRDRDQVVYRGTKSGSFHEYDPITGKWPEHEDQQITPEMGCEECRANIRKVSRVVMVDQLWMWILDEQTIITCFPKRYGSNKQENDSSSVHKSVRMRLQNARQNHIRSVFDLALIIIDECSNTFFDRTKTRDRQPQVIDAFSEAIGNVTNKQTAAFDRLYRWTKSASKIYRAKGKVDTESISELHVPLLDIYPEGILQREIKDIIEELNIMIDINRTQKQVLNDFVMHIEHILDPHGIYGIRHRRAKNQARSRNVDDTTSGHDKRKGFNEKDEDRAGRNSEMGVDGKAGKPIDRDDEKDEKHQVYDWFKVNADETLEKVSKRIEELELLKRTAQSTSSSLTDLLALKQQQASVVQAWQSVKQSEEAVSQGRSIMMFTVVTIFFLPLSFMASVFGMNAVDFGQGQVALIDEFKYMFPISFGVIIPTFIIAFSTWTRALIWYAYKCTITFTLVKTGIYGNWLNLGLPSRTLYDKAGKQTEKLKNQVRQQRCQQRRDQRKKEDKEWEESHGLENLNDEYIEDTSLHQDDQV